jgi:zinc/manganese transport system ATP-binding protein
VSSGPAVVELHDVTVTRGGRTVWSDGTLTIPAGGVVLVIGPNGSGKTTLFEVLLGLLPTTAGTVTVLGATPERGNARIGYVPQNYTASVGDAVRCIDLVTLGISGPRWGVRGVSADEKARVRAALDSVGAADLATRRISELSGGQQQRVAIAQALVHEPDLLLLDEPLANLDVRSQHEIADLLGELKRARPVTILVIAHDMNPLLSQLDGVVYLLDGHPHYGAVGDVVDETLLTHLYGTRMRVVRTAQGDLFTRSV